MRQLPFNLIISRLEKDLGMSANMELARRVSENFQDSMKEVWPLYQEGFCGVEKELWENLAIYKEITIREHVYHLLNDMSNEIKDTIDGHIQKLQNTLRILKNINIKRIEELTDDLYNGACFNIDRFYSGISLSADSYQSLAKDSCRSIIRSGGRLRNYKDDEAPRINRTITEKANQYTSTVRSRASQSADVVIREISRFRSEFHSHYKDMPSLKPKMDYAPSMTSISSTSIDLSVSSSQIMKRFLVVGLQILEIYSDQSKLFKVRLSQK